MAFSLSRLYNLAIGKYPNITQKGEGSPPPLRIGILGAAAIAPRAVIYPAKMMPDKVEIYSVAARDPGRAKVFARKYSIEHTHDTYQELISDPNVDAIYIPLPNGLHYEWTMLCIEHGKPVLLEKPSSSNAEQTEKIFAAAKKNNVLVVEAFHWFYHPAFKFVKDIVSNVEEFGEIEQCESAFCITKFDRTDIRFNFALAGGSLMDVGCYPIAWIRYLIGEDPIAARSLQLTTSPDDDKIDTFASVEFSFASSNKKKAVVSCGLQTPLATMFKLGFIPQIVVTSRKKTLVFAMPNIPHLYHNISIRDLSTRKVQNQTCFEKGKEHWTTYAYQLEAFADAVKGLKSAHMYSGEDSVSNMKAIDLTYEALGLPSRV
ncbi:hypothetical protein V1512DRAFT_119578 [Lipomyces arxii]|uniref:uncharacterized protein n=1 Tax=Lipomyces arxii TaxID=56418 RepID=UPI0034D002E0